MLNEIVFDLPKGKGLLPWKTNAHHVRELKRLMEMVGPNPKPSNCEVSMPKVKRSKRALTVTVRDMSRYEEAVDKLIENVESLEWDADDLDELDRAKRKVEEMFDDLRTLADAVRFEFQMMQIERKECVRPTILV